MALLAQRHRDGACWLVLQTHTSNVPLLWGVSLPDASSSPALKMRTSADSSQTEGASLESCCSASTAHGTARREAQILGLLACLVPQTSNVSRGWGVLPVSSSSSTPKMRMSPDSSRPEGDSLESCCSASSAPGPARTEAQRVGLLTCIVTSIFKAISGGPW